MDTDHLKPQTRAVLALMRRHPQSGVTPRQALIVVGTNRLAARVAELRAAGYAIESRHLGKGVWMYRLTGEPVAA